MTEPNGSNEQGTGEEGRGEMGSIVSQTKEMVANIGAKAKETVTDRLSNRQSRSALELNGIADALRQKGEELDGSVLGPIVSAAAEKVDRASEYIMDAKLGDVVKSTESFARREPALFLGGAFALGVLCARILKSSAHREPEVANDEGAGT